MKNYATQTKLGKRVYELVQNKNSLIGKLADAVPDLGFNLYFRRTPLADAYVDYDLEKIVIGKDPKGKSLIHELIHVLYDEILTEPLSEKNVEKSVHKIVNMAARP